MPKFRITTPEGKTYEVTAPEGTTKDQALAYAKSHHQASARANPIQDVIKGGISGLGNTLASVAGQVNPGLNMLDTFKSVGDVSNMIDQVRAGGKPKYNAPAMSPGQTSAAMLTNITGQNYSPETGAGRWSKALGTMLPGALLPGSIPARIANVLGPTIGSEGAADVTRSMGGGENAQNIARMAGGIAGGLAVVPRVSVNRGGPPVPKPQARAASYLDRVVRSAKVTPETLAQADPRLTAAEAIGQPGKAALGALARQAGATGDDLAGLVSARRMARPNRILNEFSDASGIDPRMVADVPTMAETAIRNASIAPDVMQGSAGADIHARLNAMHDAAKSNVNLLYDAARAAKAEGAQLTKEAKPIVAANLREAMADFDPQAVPRVSKHLDSLDGMKSVTARDLYEMRTRVGKLRASADPVEGEAAGTLVKAIDGEIANAIDNNAFAGDTGVIDRWREAIAARADFGRKFQGKDAIQSLTERTYRGGQRTNKVAPEDASNVLLGKGMSGRPNDIRDLTSLRDRLGADSPEWQSLQREAFSRIVGKDAGKETFGQSWNQFSQKNPQLADLLLTPEDRANLTASRNTIASAQAARDAFQNGEQRLFDPNTNARQFKASIDQMSGADLTAHRAGIANKLFNLANSGSFNPKALTVPHVAQKLEVLFGKAGSQKLIATAEREAEMAAFENRYQPAGNSITAEMNAAMGDQADAFGSLLDNVGGVAKAVSEPRKSLLQGVGSLAQMGADYYRKPWSTAQRDFAGQQLMMSPQELAALIKQFQASKPKLTLGVSSTARPLSAAVAQELQSRRRVSQPAKSAR